MTSPEVGQWAQGRLGGDIDRRAGAVDDMADAALPAGQDAVAVVDDLQRRAVVEADSRQSGPRYEASQSVLAADLGVVVRAQQQIEQAQAADYDVRPGVVSRREGAGIAHAGTAPADRSGTDACQHRAI